MPTGVFLGKVAKFSAIVLLCHDNAMPQTLKMELLLFFKMALYLK